MKDKVNFYFATLLIVVAGATAGWLIYHLATTNTFTATFGDPDTDYTQLKKSLLEQ